MSVFKRGGAGKHGIVDSPTIGQLFQSQEFPSVDEFKGYDSWGHKAVTSDPPTNSPWVRA